MLTGFPIRPVGIAARTMNGVRGEAAFDEAGNLIGVISTGLEEAHSFVSLSWPLIYEPIAPKWPRILSERVNPSALWPSKACAESST
jgi:hypothetical protein